MNDFVRDLRGELVSAAERLERRRRSRWRFLLPRPGVVRVAWAAPAAALVVAALVLVLFGPGRDESRLHERRPQPATALEPLVGRYSIQDPLPAGDPITGLTVRPADDPLCASLLGRAAACYQLLTVNAGGETGAHEWGRIEATADRVVLSAVPGQSCSGYPGTYRWTLSGERLRLQPVSDPCPAAGATPQRRRVLSQAMLRRGP